MTTTRPDPRTAELLRAVADGEVVDVFIVFRRQDGSWGYCFRCDDVDETLFEVRTAAIRMRARFGGEGEG